MSRKRAAQLAAKDRDSARNWFRANGVSITEWATARGFNRDHVYAVLSGRNLGDRGTAHRIAVALGIKEETSSAAERQSADARPKS